MIFNREYINRPIYLDRIKPYFDKDLIKGLVGQRITGKSYMLFQIIDELKVIHNDPEILYINKELDELEFIKDHNDLLVYIKAESRGKEKIYLFIDEIQEIIGFEKALRSLQAGGNYDIYCTGSNAKLLSGELATYLSGRYIELKIYGLSNFEFLKFHKLDKSGDSLLKYFKYCGLPFLINLELKDQVIYEYLRNIYDAILFKDVVKRFSIRNIAFLENLVRYVADNVGSIVSSK